METAENFDLASHALTEIKVDTWGPFIFVNLDPNCQPLAITGSQKQGQLNYKYSARHNIS